jgi:integrase
MTKLTAHFVKGAKAQPGKDRTIYWDETKPGFGLMVTRGGHRSYVAQYRSNGRSRRFTIGNAAKINLDQARKKATAVFGKVTEGGDPANERREAAAANKNTLKAAAERYLAREGTKLRTTAKRRATLERLVFPKLGDRQIDKIKRSDIQTLLDAIERERGSKKDEKERPATAMADQVLALLRRIFNWHAIRDDDFVSPIVRGMARRKPEERERDRVLTDDELRQVWSAATSLTTPWSQFVRLLLVTAARRTEVAAMGWAELNGGDTWTIPAQRYKTGAEVTLPLSTAAKKLLAEIPRIQGCEFVFTTDGRRPISGFSTLKLRLDAASGVKDWRLHDLRRTARSLLSRAGVNPDVAERCLGHAIPGMRGVYDRHRYIEEMRHAFEALASQIERIVNPQPNVIALGR